MTADEIKNRFPRASESFIRANLSADCAGPVAKLERDSGNAPLATEEIQRQAGARFLVRIKSVRKRLLDQDNLCEKYHVDLCRYSGIITNDSPAQVEIQTCQRKAAKGEAEYTEIEVSNL